MRDALGREQTFQARPTRVVALNSNALDAMRILRAQDLVVGVSTLVHGNRAYWGPLADLPAVGKWNGPNLEAIAMLRPDVVLCYGNNPGPGFEERLGALSIAVLRLDLHRLHSLPDELMALATLLDRRAEAEDFLAWHRALLARIADATEDARPRPRAYVESYGDLRVSGPGTGINEMVLAAGVDNIAAEMSVPFAEVTPEWVAVRDPEIIIKAASTSDSYACTLPGRLPAKREAMLSRSGWGSIKAVRDRRVLVISSDICPGPRAAVGAAYIAAFARPWLAAALDPEGAHREYLERFVGLPLRGCYTAGETLP